MNFAAGHSLLRAAPAARARRYYSRARNVLERRGAHEFGARSKGLRCIRRPSLSAFSTQAGPFLPSRGFQSPTATACATPSLRGRLSIGACSASLCPRCDAQLIACRVCEARKTRRSFRSSLTFDKTSHACRPMLVQSSRSSLSSMQISSAWRGQCVIRVNWISRP